MQKIADTEVQRLRPILPYSVDVIANIFLRSYVCRNLPRAGVWSVSITSGFPVPRTVSGKLEVPNKVYVE